MSSINVSLDTRYPVAWELVIETDLATSEPSPALIAAVITRTQLSAA